nr:MAG TPA: hypothetical protein [Caudoviricetes sp.]
MFVILPQYHLPFDFGYKNNSHTNVWVVHCFRR